jgi:sugar phosphate isomerase/epimerase
LLETHGLGVCLDIGHLLLGGYDVQSHLAKYRDRLHLMHIHGVNDGRDHQSLRHLDPELLKAAVKAMAGGDDYRVMTVEVFNETDFTESMAVLEAYEA